LLSTLLTGAICAATLSGCVIQNARSVVSIEKTDTVGLVDYYTITYSDGTTGGFTVTNGKDGEDAESLTAKDVYETYKEIYPTAGLSFADFCELYLSVDSSSSATNSVAAINSALRSCLKVYCGEASQSGSGVIYKIGEEYTYLVTCYHVVYYSGAESGNSISGDVYAYIYGSDDGPYLDSEGGTAVVKQGDYGVACEYVGGSAAYDVAVLRVKTENLKKVNSQIQAVTPCYEYTVGEAVYAIGNPNSAGLSVTSGIISVESENVTLTIDEARSFRVLRTDADLDHGSSGCGIFNSNGEYIAMCDGGSESITSINYALQASQVTAVADGIMYYAADSEVSGTKKLLLGVTVTSTDTKYVYDDEYEKGRIVEDIVVSKASTDGSVNPTAGKPAAKMGLQPGDIITGLTINGEYHKLCRSYNIGDLLLTVRSGDKVIISYTRNSFECTTGEYTVSDDDLVSV